MADKTMAYAGAEANGLFFSRDSDENWQYLSTISDSDAVQIAFATRILRIAIESANPQHMYATPEVGGSDSGATWKERVLPESAANVISVVCGSD